MFIGLTYNVLGIGVGCNVLDENLVALNQFQRRKTRKILFVQKLVMLNLAANGRHSLLNVFSVVHLYLVHFRVAALINLDNLVEHLVQSGSVAAVGGNEGHSKHSA